MLFYLLFFVICLALNNFYRVVKCGVSYSYPDLIFFALQKFSLNILNQLLLSPYKKQLLNLEHPFISCNSMALTESSVCIHNTEELLFVLHNHHTDFRNTKNPIYA